MRRKVAAELGAVRKRLTTCGLLDEPDLPTAARRAWWAPAAVALLGLAGILTGLVDGPDIGSVALVATLVALVAAVFALAPRQRVRTRAADAVLARLRREHAYLAPSANPSWSTYGAGGAAMGVALFGEATLRMAEPALATAILTGPFAGTRSRRRARAGGHDSYWPVFGMFDGSSGGGGCGGGGAVAAADPVR